MTTAPIIKITPGRKINSPAVINVFDGGLNLRDSPDQIAENETPDCMNVTMDERGGVAARLGLARKNAAAMAGTPKLVFYWQGKGKVIVQIGATLYKTSDFVTFTSFATLTTSARVGITEFLGQLIVAHPVDGVFKYDDTTWTNVTTAVKGDMAANWQNKIFVAGDPGAVTRVYRGDAGAITFTGPSFTDIREPDDAKITALGGAPGMDVSGRPGLLVFKKRSTHRVYSASDGAYTTISVEVGAASPLAVVASPLGPMLFMSDIGIFETNGIDQPTLLSGKLEPLFTKDGLNSAEAQLALMCAGVHRDRLVFSLPRSGASVNNLTLEYHPRDKWFVPHSFGVGCFAQYETNIAELLAASNQAAYLLKCFSGGTDNDVTTGNSIVSRWQSYWLDLDVGRSVRLQGARLWGRGTSINAYIRRDFETGQGDLFPLDFPSGSAVWGSGQWGSFQWTVEQYEKIQDLQRLGVAHHVSLRLEKTHSAAALGPALLGDGTAPEIGNFALYGARFDRIPLGSV